ncbi:MAG TPA: SH3 domain-containing protein, partial [Pyrinomonadaceae bacterium]
MAQTGTVIPQGLNLRATPGGTVITVLAQGTTVQILQDQGEFLKVSAGGQTGFVKASLIRRDQPQQPGGTFHFVGNKAVAPDGTVFGTKSGPGIFNLGQTSISDFVQAHGGDFPGLSASRLRVMQAVSVNEGKLEAINTFDNAFLTFGAFQWTAGTGSAAGELPSLIARLKQTDAAVFNQLFGQSGLDVASVSSPAGQPPTGFFSLNGATIKSVADKEKNLRTLERAFQFFKAGQNDTMRRVEVEHAAGRIDLFYRDASHKIRGRFVADFVTSEFGVALLLDEHVNRPGHVPGTLAGAVDQHINATGKNDPTTWTDQDERKLMDIYIQRRNNTSMTDSK